MEFIPSKIEEVILIKPNVCDDNRGFFLESYKKSIFTNNGISANFVQDNHSKSSHGVLRGLHYQLVPKTQAKLVRCPSGNIFNVAVDIRSSSPTFGQWVGYELSEDNKFMLYVPGGFAHGFLTLSESAELLYKTSDEYSEKHERVIIYNDPTIGIEWPKLDSELLLSAKDQQAPVLANAEMNFPYGEF